LELFPAYVIHSVTGRTRLQIPAKRGDGLFFANVEASLQSCTGIDSVRFNSRAASILITYTSDSNLKSIADFARKRKLFNLRGNQPVPVKTLGEVLASQVGQVDRLVATGSRGHLDSQSIFFLLFLGLGLLQMWRGQIMQPAIPLLWRAMEILKDIEIIKDIKGG
jgi:hypothetical protein